MVLVFFSIAGLLGIVAGFWAKGAGAKRCEEEPSSPLARRLRVARWLGYALAVASWPLTGVVSYPFADNAGRPGRIAGMPFPAAYFDSTGADYVGVITLVACIGNAIFWALLPRLAVMVGAIVQERRAVRRAG